MKVETCSFSHDSLKFGWLGILGELHTDNPCQKGTYLDHHLTRLGMFEKLLIQETLIESCSGSQKMIMSIHVRDMYIAFKLYGQFLPEPFLVISPYSAAELHSAPPELHSAAVPTVAAKPPAQATSCWDSAKTLGM